MRHLPFIAKTADQQVGRLMDALRDQGLLDETLVVITADHAAQTGRRFHGRFDTFTVGTNINACDPATPTSPAALRSDCNWYYGQESGPLADEAYLDPSPAIQQLKDALTPPNGETNLRFSYQDGHIAAWLNDTSEARKQEAAEAILDLPDVIASFTLADDGDDYVLHGTNLPGSGPERSWFRRHGETLVDTMAAPYGPDVVALLRNNTTYGVMGDHGGHQQQVQRDPDGLLLARAEGEGADRTDAPRRRPPDDPDRDGYRVRPCRHGRGGDRAFQSAALRVRQE